MAAIRTTSSTFAPTAAPENALTPATPFSSSRSPKTGGEDKAGRYVIRAAFAVLMALFTLLSAAAADAAIAVDATSYQSGSGNIIVPHPTSGSNRLMLVGISVGADSVRPSISCATWLIMITFPPKIG